jgi:hypothetical protein
MYLNANIPLIECYVRGNYLRDQRDSHDKYFWCVVFGVTSIPKQVPLFNFHMEDGGVWWRAPISAFCQSEGVKEQPLHDLVLWDSFSHNIAVTTFYQLDGATVTYTSRDKQKYQGRYLFTLDWAEGDYNELNYGYASRPDQHKCGHVLALDNGNFAIQPNNRCRVFDSNMGVDLTQPPLITRLVNTHRWTVEDQPRWTTTETEEGQYDYDYKDTEKQEKKVNKRNNKK